MIADWAIPLAALIVSIATLIWSQINRGRTRSELTDIRMNHLHEIRSRIDRIEQKLDTHLQWHLQRGDRESQ